jgi:anti-anti-sigma factor
MLRSEEGLPGALEIAVGVVPTNGRSLPRLAVTGELDIAGVPALEAALADLEAARPEAIVVDLTHLEFLDSSGLRCLVSADARAREAGGRLAILTAGDSRVAQTLALTGLDEHLEVVVDVEAVGAAAEGA